MAEHKPSADPTQALGGAGVLGGYNISLDRFTQRSCNRLPPWLRAGLGPAPANTPAHRNAIIFHGIDNTPPSADMYN